MTLRTVVLPLGFGLSAVLAVSARSADEEPSPPPRPPVRLYTNEDLERVHPFRDQTGVRSVPAVAPDDETGPAPVERRRGRGEGYWRREAARVRERVASLTARAADLRAEVAAKADEASHVLGGRGRRSSASLSGPGSLVRLQARLLALEKRIREAEDDLADRARRDGALPGWLR